MDDPEIGVKDVMRDELELIKRKRKERQPDDDHEGARNNLFGIALSGGGIRSATVNLGVLKVLKDFGILRRADYLSTVSGGGYIGSYVHAKLNKTKSFDDLFTGEDIASLRGKGDYLTPGAGISKVLSRLRLGGSFLFSFLMNLVWVVLLFVLVVWGLHQINTRIVQKCVTSHLLWVPGAVLGVHFLLHPLRQYKLWPVNALYWVEGILLIPIAAYVLSSIGSRYFPWIVNADLHSMRGPSIIFLVTGFFANPNMLTLHRFYRDRLADAYLRTVGRRERNTRLRDIDIVESGAPYPLINTCLNLLGAKDRQFPGTKGSDFYLLSPKYCGAESTGYVATGSPAYRGMTLSTAVAVSGAAVSPNRGLETNRFLAFIMTVLNLRLGYWAWNPRKSQYFYYLKNILYSWWPQFHVAELTSKTNTNRGRVSLSDGGHIENLAIYELLRRRCKLIIAVDAGADPDYTFQDLKNLAIRARNTLGISLVFKQSPEDVIKPASSNGFSRGHFAIADIYELPPTKEEKPKQIGLLVYLKSSLLAPRTKQPDQPQRSEKADPEALSLQYKTTHADFPHESTADQFFDEWQWNAYYILGTYMAGDLLRTDLRNRSITQTNRAEMMSRNIDQLYEFFSA